MSLHDLRIPIYCGHWYLSPHSSSTSEPGLMGCDEAEYLDCRKWQECHQNGHFSIWYADWLAQPSWTTLSLYVGPATHQCIQGPGIVLNHLRNYILGRDFFIWNDFFKELYTNTMSSIPPNHLLESVCQGCWLVDPWIVIVIAISIPLQALLYPHVGPCTLSYNFIDSHTMHLYEPWRGSTCISHKLTDFSSVYSV